MVPPDDVADILFTSGTTGRSKGAMSAHRQTIGVARAWAELGGVRQDDRYLVVNPFFHSFGYKIGIVVGLLTGCTLYPVATFDVDATMQLIETERITVFPGAPTLYQSMLAAPGRGERDLSSLRLAVTGAAVVPVVLIERMRAGGPDGLAIDHVVTAFGMTEAVVVTMCREGDSAETIATTCGRAIPGMETRIARRRRAAGQGRLRDARLPRRRGGHRRGDRRRRLAAHRRHRRRSTTHGNLRITDRLKDMYISGGFNVYPAEVEQALMRMDGVTDVAVVGVPDERMGEVGKAYVVGRPASPPEDVVAYAKEKLANFKVPRQVELVESLPRNLSGKVLKTELQELMDLDLSESELAFQAEAREWLAANVPAEPLPSMDTEEGWALHQEWEARLTEARWSVVSLAAGVPRPRGLAGRVGDLRGGVLPRRGAGPGLPERHLPARADHLRPRHQGAAGPLPADDGHRRADLGAVLVRARGRLRPRLAQVDRPARRRARRLGAQRPEDLVVAGDVRALGLRAVPLRPRGRSGTAGSPTSSSRSTPTASRSGRSRSSTARPGSPRCSSRTSSCRTPTCSVASATAGRSR